MTKNSAVYVPFLKSEWETVAKLYCSDSVDDLFKGLQIVTSWQLRMASNLPTFVSLTAMMLRARLNKAVLETDETLPIWSKDDLSQNFDSIVIIRFVNFLYELTQAKCNRWITVQEAANNFGIPKWIVDLRHAATHAVNMPDRKVCCDAVKYLSNWLRDNYWSKVTTEMPKKKEFYNSKSVTIALNLYKHNSGFVNEEDSEQNDILARKKGKFFRCVRAALKHDHVDFFEKLSAQMILSPKFLKHWQWDICKLTDHLALPSLLLLHWRRMFVLIKKCGRSIGFLICMLGKLYADNLEPIAASQCRSWILRLLVDGWFSGLNKTEWQEILRQFVKVQNYDEFDKEIYDELLKKSGLSDNLASHVKIDLLLYQHECDVSNLSTTEVDTLIISPLLTAPSASGKKISAGLWALDDRRLAWDNMPLGLVPLPTQQQQYDG